MNNTVEKHMNYTKSIGVIGTDIVLNNNFKVNLFWMSFSMLIVG